MSMTSRQFRSARLRLNMSLARFATALGYRDRQSIARMENGKSPVTPRAELAVMRLMIRLRLSESEQ